jgi:hypothetical protein
MEKKYETFTYSELIQEFRTVTEKTEGLKRDLILEMAKRKELEGIEGKKIAGVIAADLKDLVSGTYIRNILSNEHKDTKYDPVAAKKRIREQAQEEEKKILVAAGMGTQELEPPQEPHRVITNDDQDITNNLLEEPEIIDQRPEEQKAQDYSDAEEDIDKIHMIRELKVENNNLIQQISDLEKLREENSQLRATIGELESENAKLFNRNKELEEENNKLKAENRALRNPPQIPAADVSSRFSNKSHDAYHQNKYKNLIKGTKK